ncbi:MULTISPECIES: nuclear transport factor 2 family protein [unclassified Novosphingobium]|uniref:nuclear transport factor 2 family protein n=1 Tax=unclassified Novosphingobium TaxID=2644732 RepID=UPI00146A5A72|nr:MULTISPECIES: nuclear transport factor 2 family protein [unclassified Novosphingobium]NMN05772.1 hypothetical protein [Novosphingobium sp. SG919]NMN87868.1 hypothetical protein [Novosphingobium sp. SG916]
MQLGLAAWHRAMLAGCPQDLLAELVAEDAVFHSPVLHTPQVGHQAVCLHLSAACGALCQGGLGYVRELVDGPEAALEFEATLDGVAVNGVHLLRFDLEGRIIDFKVLVRPFAAADLLWRKMAEALEDD